MAFIKCSGGGGIQWKDGSFAPKRGTISVDMEFAPTMAILTRGFKTNGDIRLSCVFKDKNSSGGYSWFRASNPTSGSGLDDWSFSGYQIQKYTEGSNSFNFKWDSNSSLPTVYWLAY